MRILGAANNSTPPEEIVALRAQLAVERAALAAVRERVAELTRERDVLRAAHERLRLELELLERRIFVAKAERVDTAQLELEFAQKLAVLDKLGGAPSRFLPRRVRSPSRRGRSRNIPYVNRQIHEGASVDRPRSRRRAGTLVGSGALDDLAPLRAISSRGRRLAQDQTAALSRERSPS